MYVEELDLCVGSRLEAIMFRLYFLIHLIRFGVNKTRQSVSSSAELHGCLLTFRVFVGKTIHPRFIVSDNENLPSCSYDHPGLSVVPISTYVHYIAVMHTSFLFLEDFVVVSTFIVRECRKTFDFCSKDEKRRLSEC